jgi:hypothetical protein
MIRAKVWFRCAAMHDPVMPVLVKPAVIGWQGKNRNIDLVIERDLKGSELVQRMKGWITVDPNQAVKVFERHGKLKCFDNGELVVEVEDRTELEALQRDLEETSGDPCTNEPLPRGPGHPAADSRSKIGEALLTRRASPILLSGRGLLRRVRPFESSRFPEDVRPRYFRLLSFLQSRAGIWPR